METGHGGRQGGASDHGGKINIVGTIDHYETYK